MAQHSSSRFSALERLSEAAERFLSLAAALLVALVAARCLELGAGVQSGGVGGGVFRLAVITLGFDALVFAKFLPALFLLCLPILLTVRSERARLAAFVAAGSILLIMHAMLVQFFLTANALLGAELFGYSWPEIRQTVAAGATIDPAVVAGLLLPPAVFWIAAMLLRRRIPLSGRSALLVIALLVPLGALIPTRPDPALFSSEYEADLAVHKSAYFVSANLAHAGRDADHAAPIFSGAPDTGFRELDPNFPFLHAEETPDLLGEHFRINPDAPPNLVFILVEGLGRAFSGPDATLGSFTPFLDELADSSLAWHNFLAPQGRTFGLLPSLFGSLPFGDHGFGDLGERMPPHVTLLSILKRHGYRVKFYGGFDLDFDNERAFFRRQEIDVMIGDEDFGPEFTRSPGHGDASWGYADSEVVAMALAAEAGDTAAPFVTILQTMTMHVPYTFPGQQRYHRVFEERLDRLGIGPARRAAYLRNRTIYESILYMDDCLRRFYQESARRPAFANTIFIITGDHRLPEIPMASKIDRYHVPLIIASPLLKAPARIRSVSSHFDVTPSLLAFLAHRFGLATPRAVTWIGSGLDMAPGFRNIHDLPLKQTKTLLVDYISDHWMINQGNLFSFSDGMHLEPARNDSALAEVTARFNRFRAANNRFSRDLALAPESALADWTAYDAGTRRAPSPALAAEAPTASLAVRDVTFPASTAEDPLSVSITVANTGRRISPIFVPLVVLLDDEGNQLSEASGRAMALPPGGDSSIVIAVRITGLPPGDYFLAAIPSHPETGRQIGAGRFHLPVRIRRGHDGTGRPPR